MEQRARANQTPNSKDPRPQQASEDPTSQKGPQPLRILPRRQASNQEARNCQRGRRQGRSLKIFAAPPQGEQGVIKLSHDLQNLKSSAGLPTAAGPSQKSSKSHPFFAPNFSMSFLDAKIAKSTKIDPKRDPFGRPKSAKIMQKNRPESSIKNTCKS